MAEGFRDRVFRWLRVDAEPHLPPGSEAGCDVFRAGIAYLRYRQVTWLLRQLGTLAGLGVAMLFIQGTTALAVSPKLQKVSTVLTPGLWTGLEALGLAAFLAQLPFSWLALRWDWDFRWYLLSDHCLRVQEGILTFREQTFTLANIQDVQIRQNPLQRLFGLWDVEVRTAGGGEAAPGEEFEGRHTSLHTARLRGVEHGARIRDRLLEKLAATRDAGLGEAPPWRPIQASLAEAVRSARTEAASLREALEG